MNLTLYARSLGLLLISSIIGSSHAFASEDQKYTELTLSELLNVEIDSASFRSQRTDQAPSKVVVIGQDLIRERNYRYLADILEDLPGVRLSLYASSVDSGSSQILVRGISGNNKVVLMWNGQRLNHPDSQPLHITPYLYPLGGIEQIEIIYGSASALYGSDTISMSINMVSADSYEGRDQPWQVGYSYGRYNEHSSHVHLGQTIDGITIDGFIDLYKTDGVDFSGFEEFYSRFPDGPGVDAGYTLFPAEERSPYYNPSEGSLTARLRLSREDSSVQVYYQQFQTQTQIGWSPLTYEANGSSGAYTFDQFGVFFTHTTAIGDRTSLVTLIDYTRNQLDPSSHWNRPNEEPFRIYSDGLDPRGVGTRTYKLNYGNRTSLQERLLWDSPDDDIHLITGLTFTSVDMMPKTANLDAPADYGDSFSQMLDNPNDFNNLTEYSLGVYVQAQYDVTHAVTLTGGFRADKYSRPDKLISTPRLVINYSDPDHGWFFKGIYSRSFLAPAAFLTYDTFSTGTAEQISNPDLKEETVNGYEVNVGHVSEAFSFEASYFFTRIQNLISQRQPLRTETRTDPQTGETTEIEVTHSDNSGDTWIQGMTVEARYRFSDKFLPYTSLTWIDGETSDPTNDDEAYDLIHAPELQAKFGVDSKWLDGDLTLYGQGQFVGEAKYHPRNYRFPASDNNGTQFTMASYTIFGAGATYQLADFLSLHIDVKNLLDTAYDQPIVGQETTSWTRIAATPGLPRRFYVGLKLYY